MSETGSGSVLAVGVLAAAVVVGGGLVPLYTVLDARRVAGATADTAALAAADARSGAVPGFACDLAARVAAASGAALLTCTAKGAAVTVGVRLTVLGLPVEAVSRAGPPGDPSGDAEEPGRSR